MAMWLTKVSADMSNLVDFIGYYEQELEQARLDCLIRGSVEKSVTAMPGITEYRFNQLQEIDAVLNYMNIQLRKLKTKHFKKFLEGYARALTSRDAERYTEGEQEVIDYEILINEVSLLRNRYLGIIKSIESKNFMLGHVVRLRTAGLEDINI